MTKNEIPAVGSQVTVETFNDRTYTGTFQEVIDGRFWMTDVTVSNGVRTVKLDGLQFIDTDNVYTVNS